MHAQPAAVRANRTGAVFPDSGFPYFAIDCTKRSMRQLRFLTHTPNKETTWLHMP
jgi:hypothetical protein